MKTKHKLQLSSLLLQKAKDFGADLAGIARVDQLLNAPSYAAAGHVARAEVGRLPESLQVGEVSWHEKGKSIFVIALSHPREKPEMDWWYGNRTPPGNRELVQIVNQTSNWIKEKFPEVCLYPLPYHLEKGGAFLKDAAVLAGLGCIGRNNLFLSPRFGPRVRLRGLVLDQELITTGPVSFDPCTGCDAYCLKGCPRGAFDEIIYSQKDLGQDSLPGRRGDYNLLKCDAQMKKDKEQSRVKEETTYCEKEGEEVRLLKYCRNCELLCPLGD